MFAHVKDLEGFRIAAKDGEIGHVTDVYFEDTDWVVRYFVVATGSWLFGRRVLVSPNSVKSVDWDKRAVCVELTREQVRDSPDIDTDRPVSRQQEAEYHLYYNFPPYWGGVALWGRYDEPGGEPSAEDTAVAEADKDHAVGADNRLRSVNEVLGYKVIAIDGQVGHVEHFLVDPQSWAIRYLVVHAGKWLSRHESLTTPKLVDRIVWADATVNINTSKALMESAPEYDDSRSLTREQETAMFTHFSVHPYWDE